ncbi:MAG TPA: GTP-binding protein [Prolixibacteraceae bacterium]|nr:GTP-binding protein [Prolixibacteraceae bacterium]
MAKNNITGNSSIPFHILSGFLGSGKTTLMKEILSQLPAGRKTGIIQNEFAPVSFDGAELKSTGAAFDLLEINNGSVFCVCLLSGFVSSLSQFLDQYSPDLLILEASGLSDTTSIAEILSHPLLSGRLYLASNWCIVDAVNFLRSGKMQQRLIHQIRMADRILINKTDLAPEAVPEITKQVRSLNPFAPIQTTTFCQTDFKPGLLPVPRFMPLPDHALSRPEVSSLVIKTTRKIPETRLSDFLNLWAPLSYRMKGFVQVSNGGTVAVHSTPGQTEIRQVAWWPGPTELMAITDRFTLREWNRSFSEFADPTNSGR